MLGSSDYVASFGALKSFMVGVREVLGSGCCLAERTAHPAPVAVAQAPVVAAPHAASSSRGPCVHPVPVGAASGRPAPAAVRPWRRLSRGRRRNVLSTSRRPSPPPVPWRLSSGGAGRCGDQRDAACRRSDNGQSQLATPPHGCFRATCGSCPDNPCERCASQAFVQRGESRRGHTVVAPALGRRGGSDRRARGRRLLSVDRICRLPPPKHRARSSSTPIRPVCQSSSTASRGG